MFGHLLSYFPLLWLLCFLHSSLLCMLNHYVLYNIHLLYFCSNLFRLLYLLDLLSYSYILLFQSSHLLHLLLFLILDFLLLLFHELPLLLLRLSNLLNSLSLYDVYNIMSIHFQSHLLLLSLHLYQLNYIHILLFLFFQHLLLQLYQISHLIHSSQQQFHL